VYSFGKTTKENDVYLESQGSVAKGETQVPIGYFCDSQYSFVSGVVYSSADPCNIPTTWGDDLLFIRNPHARNPIEAGWPRIGHEYSINDGQLVHSNIEVA
jgi:hypothetical protein